MYSRSIPTLNFSHDKVGKRQKTMDDVSGVSRARTDGRNGSGEIAYRENLFFLRRVKQIKSALWRRRNKEQKYMYVHMYHDVHYCMDEYNDTLNEETMLLHWEKTTEVVSPGQRFTPTHMRVGLCLPPLLFVKLSTTTIDHRLFFFSNTYIPHTSVVLILLRKIRQLSTISLVAARAILNMYGILLIMIAIVREKTHKIAISSFLNRESRTFDTQSSCSKRNLEKYS